MAQDIEALEQQFRSLNLSVKPSCVVSPLEQFSHHQRESR